MCPRDETIQLESNTLDIRNYTLLALHTCFKLTHSYRWLYVTIISNSYNSYTVIHILLQHHYYSSDFAED